MFGNFFKRIKKLQFVSPDTNHRYVRKLAETLDIEFVDINEVSKSNKTLMVWNPYGYLAHQRYPYIKKHELYEEYKTKRKPIYIVERGALPNTIFIDETGFNVESELYNEEYWNRPLNAYEISKTEKYISELVQDESSLEPQSEIRMDKDTFLAKLNLGHSQKKIVFVPMQLHNDTVTILWCDWIKSIKKFQTLIKQLAQENPNIIFVIKNHPTETDRTYYMLHDTLNLKIADNIHYKDCIKYSDVVLTVNSGVGLQAMMWKKPTIIIGKSFYQFDEINYKANNKEDIISLIYNAKVPNMEKVIRFIHYLRYEYYCICYMQKLSKNSSFPTLFEKITYRDLDGKRVNHVTKIENDIMNIFVEFVSLLQDYCLIKISCLDCIRIGEALTDKQNLYLGTRINEDIIQQAIKMGYTYENGIFSKQGINIHIDKPIEKTKFMSFYGKQVKVPFPVTPYLRRLYGKKWREYNG